MFKKYTLALLMGTFAFQGTHCDTAPVNMDIINQDAEAWKATVAHGLRMHNFAQQYPVLAAHLNNIEASLAMDPQYTCPSGDALWEFCRKTNDVDTCSQFISIAVFILTRGRVSQGQQEEAPTLESCTQKYTENLQALLQEIVAAN